MNDRYCRARRRSSHSLSRSLAFETLENRQLLAGTPITVFAAGTTGTETFQLQIDGVTVASWTNTRVYNSSTRVFDAFTYTHPTDVAVNRIRVAFTNDGTVGGVNRDLWVDGIAVNNAKYETEASTVFSTGIHDVATGGRLPGFRRYEALHYNGYFQYGAANSTIQILAAGKTGQEQMQLLIGGQTVATYNNVGGNYDTGVYQTFTFNYTSAIPLNQIRVAFTNDGLTSTGLDKNLRVDAILLDGQRFESEAPSVFTTGYAPPGQGRVPGRWQQERLYLNGYFQYGAAGSVIEVRAAGRSGEERMELQIAGQTVATYNNVGGNFTTGAFQTFYYVHPTIVPLSQVRVAFANDGTTSGGLAKDLRVDSVSLDGTVAQAEAANTFSTGFWQSGIGSVTGLWQSEYLYVGGYLQFASTAVPGTLALATTLVSINEGAGTASIPVSRTGGTDGTVALRYTTVNGSATAGSDFTGASAQLLIFLPGETTKSIIVPINNDAIDEDNEVFNVATDQPLGSATLLAPRTATITIVDNDGPPPLGTGNGLLGAYFDDVTLADLVVERTDPTVNFDYGSGSPDSQIASDTFSARWTGKVEARFTETFTFRTTSDDGVRLWVNGQLIIDDWNDHPAMDRSGSIALVAGQKYSIVLEYYENSGDAEIALAWSSPSQPLEIIPKSQLYSDPPAPIELGTFSGEDIITGLDSPTAIAFDSSGRMFVSQQPGVVRVFKDGALLSAPFIDIRDEVNFVADRGMLGIAVHPNFPATPYVYVSYTYDPPEAATHTGLAGRDGGGNRVARVTRFTADAATGFNTAVPGSEVVIIGSNSVWANISSPDQDSTDVMTLPPSGGMNGTMRDILISDSLSHTVGNMAFGPDGMLYVANGDGTSYGRVDPRTIRVQNIDSLSGKILRVDPLTGQGLADNPFYNGDPDANRSKVYDYGLRNPFRFAFQPGSGTLYIGDVGWNTWEEINRGRAENFGWPYYEGGVSASEQTGGYRDLAEAQAFYATNPDVQAPLWTRQHSEGGVAIVAGDFYTGNEFPSTYHNALFISDIGDNQVRVMRFNSDGGVSSVAQIGLSAGFIVEMTMSPDGSLYYADLVGGIVGRITYTPPAAPVMAAQVADIDDNGRVDGNDFLAWQRGFGVETAAPDLAAWKGSFALAPTKSLQDELGDSPFAFAVTESGSQAAAVRIEQAATNSVGSSAVMMMTPILNDAAPCGVSAPTKARGAAHDDALASLDDDPFDWVEAP